MMRAASALCLIAAFASLAFAQDSVQMGIAHSMVVDLSKGQKKFIDSEFVDLVKEFTGLSAKLDQSNEWDALAKKVADGSIQFGIFQGVEVAWATHLHPELKPLMIARYKDTMPRAYLLAKKDGPADVAALKGKTVGWLKAGREHVRLFLESRVNDLAKATPDKFFGKLENPLDGETALDDILLDNVVAAAVDETAVNLYKDIKPGAFNRLKVLVESEDFPRSALVYHPGKVAPAVVEKFRGGLLKANQSEKGKESMGNFKISAFELPEPAYQMSLGAILKKHPTPKK
jgi:ABC-type phosphate/phosphonate transport system substrate-binding protein